MTPPQTTRMSPAPCCAQCLDQLRHQGLVARRLGGDADHVHVVLDGLPGRLLRGLEQRADVDVEAEVGEGRGDHLGAAVVAVLAQLDHQHARPAAFARGQSARPPA